MQDLIDRKKDLLRRLIAAKDAQQDLLAYTQLTMPDHQDHSANPRSRYSVGPHHKAMKSALHDLTNGVSRRAIINCGPRHGKAIDASTHMLTSRGWVIASDVVVGDKFVGSSGGWTTVLGVYPQGTLPAYDVVFSDGCELRVCAEHLWSVQTRKGRTATRPTRDLAPDLISPDGRSKWRIPVAGQWVGLDTTMPIDPYVLGLWLGDGSSYKAEITTMDESIVSSLRAAGYEVKPQKHQAGGLATTYGVNGGLLTALKSLGLIGNKHVPDAYLFADAGSRLAILQGLCDTDGTVAKNGSQQSFCTTLPALACAFRFLVRSLGGVTTEYRKENEYKGAWIIHFRLPKGLAGFRLQRKNNRLTAPCKRNTPRRFIREIKPAPACPMVCFSVDAPDRLFAAGTELILTHNTELATKRFIAWYSAQFPQKSLIFGTYNDTFAGDIGRAVRDIINTPEHQLVFPDHKLKEGSASAQRLETLEGGLLTFVGRGGSITGRGGDGIVIDDPIKDRQEADSKLIRDQLWTWFTQVIGTRLMTQDSFMLLIQTRWHADDLVGRLTDPTNAYYDKKQAEKWKIIDFPALALDDDILGRKPGEALWPERFPREFLLQQQDLDSRGFQALYQGRPSAAGGNFFQADDLRTYKPDELPLNLRYYVASDHAVSTLQNRDKTCLLPVGVDDDDNIYVLQDVYWRKEASDVVVDQMVNIIKKYKPLRWWAERGQISKAIGPFLRKRMNEEKAYCSIHEMTPATDKQSRAQSIQARTAMGKVFFPATATWWPDARDQLLKFPNSAHDDFVDALSYIGLGLNQQVSPNVLENARRTEHEGSFGWLLRQTQLQEQASRNAQSTADW